MNTTVSPTAPQSSRDSFNRPGVSGDYLTAAGCHHVGEGESIQLYGFKPEGIAIPFPSLVGQPIMDNGKPYARVRLYTPTESQKYHQRAGSQTHIYIPHNFREMVRGSTLVTTEGEFKAMALAESGIAAVGLCGINGALRNVDGETKLHPELVQVLEFHKPARVIFLGDSDTVFNADFSREGSKLRKAVFDSKRFAFVEKFCVAVCPLGGPKGVDDVRGAMGAEFNTWFTALADAAFVVPSKATPAEVFRSLLCREAVPVRASLNSGDEHDQHRNRVKLLQSAGRLQHEPGAMLLVKPLLADLLGVNESKVSRMIRDAGGKASESGSAPAKTASPQVSKSASPELEPWPVPMSGMELLDALAAEFIKFLVLPPHADTILALWTLHTYSWEQCEYSPIVAITSPVRSCGKSRVLDVLEKVVCRPFRTGNMSEAVLFRVLDARKPSVLIDEFDTIPEERRDALANILKHGFHRAGRVHRVEGESEKKVVEFVVFGPKALACIKLSTLDAPTVSRCINIRMQRKKSAQKVARLRRYSGTEWQQKCLRWTNDHREQIEAATAAMPDALGDREQDIYEPLFVLANLAGGDWPDKLTRAALALCGESADAATDSSVLLLGWIQTHFSESGTDKVSSADLVRWLNKREDAPFSSWSNGKGIGQNEVRRLMAGFEVQPNTVRIGDKTAKGFKREWFQDAFDAYLPAAPVENGNTVTTPANIDDSRAYPPVTREECCRPEKCVPTNKDGHCYHVTAAVPETTPEEGVLL